MVTGAWQTCGSNLVMKRMFTLFPAFLPLLGYAGNTEEEETQKERPNILFITVDDLRPELACYGETQIISPNIDRLASESYFFERSYCNIPVSGASRASLFTGIRSHVNTFLTAASWIDKDAGNAITLPELLKKSGYYTISESKVYHHDTDREQSWDERYRDRNDTNPEAWKNYVVYKGTGAKNEKPPAYECADVADEAYIDGRTAENAMKHLRALKEKGKPFFLGVGFLKPHLPFNAPAKYWKMYDRNELKVPENFRLDFPTIPKRAFHNSGELRTYKDIPEERLFSEDFAKLLIHGYYACVSYVDAQIGKMLDELKRLELDKNTIVVLLGDHGWNLGEHAMWNKHCNFSTSLEAPLMIKVPGRKGSAVCSVVEFVDIYPTLCDLCGVEKPVGQLQGESLLPVMENPRRLVKEYAVAKFKNAVTLITPRYTYTEWFSADDKMQDRMLFDLEVDREENLNVAENASMKSLVNKLSKELRKRRGY